MSNNKGLLQRLANKECVMVAEGYMFEFERRGYLQAGAFVPEVVLEHPNMVESLHREFVHAGSDVVVAIMTNTTKEMLRVVDREKDMERMNRTALRIAKRVADETKTMMAGLLCPTTMYDPTDKKCEEAIMTMFKDQVKWAKEEGADFMIGETFTDFGEAKMALDAIKTCGMPAVITMAPMPTMKTRDGMTYAEACRKLEECGADVVGLNCCCGPETMMEMMREIRKTCKGPLAALPVTYRCTKECPTMQTLVLPETDQRAYPNNLDYFMCSCEQIAQFGRMCKEMNVQYVGLCCGDCCRYFRCLCESMGRKPQASRYSCDMTKHYILGDKKNPALHDCNLTTLRTMFGCK
jgi:betaine-homocysteine S-methyltransferase